MGAHASFRYFVRDRETGEIVAEGSARECAERLGVTTDTIRKWGTGYYHSYKWEVTRVGLEIPMKNLNKHGLAEAARSWDAFCEPIRKKYGVEVKPWP